MEWKIMILILFLCKTLFSQNIYQDENILLDIQVKDNCVLILLENKSNNVLVFSNNYYSNDLSNDTLYLGYFMSVFSPFPPAPKRDFLHYLNSINPGEKYLFVDCNFKHFNINIANIKGVKLAFEYFLLKDRQNLDIVAISANSLNDYFKNIGAEKKLVEKNLITLE